MPLQRRVPKRGFTNIFKKQFQIVNLKDLDRVKKAKAITPEVLFDSGVINKKNIPVKILGEGDLKKAVDISAHAFSVSAKEKIEKSGGKVVVL
jgi:large subunit ribosomal protein L15